MSDLIDRQTAIDALIWKIRPHNSGDGTITMCVMSEELVRKTLNDLPSAQPEIIRCKDCKHRDPEDRKCDCGHDILWQLPRQDDWYCADAERRTDG